MNKTSELAILAGAITALGNDSYLGPWLASIAGEVERDIRSDFSPSPTIGGTVAACARLEKEAAARCEEKIARAEKQAAEEIRLARVRAEGILSRALSAIRECENTLTK